MQLEFQLYFMKIKFIIFQFFFIIFVLIYFNLPEIKDITLTLTQYIIEAYTTNWYRRNLNCGVVMPVFLAGNITLKKFHGM